MRSKWQKFCSPRMLANVSKQFEKVVCGEQKWLLTEKNAKRTKVDNYLAVIIHFNQCSISDLEQINHR